MTIEQLELLKELLDKFRGALENKKCVTKIFDIYIEVDLYLSQQLKKKPLISEGL